MLTEKISLKRKKQKVRVLLRHILSKLQKHVKTTRIGRTFKYGNLRQKFLVRFSFTDRTSLQSLTSKSCNAILTRVLRV